LRLPEKIRTKAGWYFLRKAMKKDPGERKARNFNNSKYIGILFDLWTEEEYNRIHKYVNKLQDSKKKVRALGYILDPMLANHVMPMLSFEYIYEKDLNWYCRPSTDKYNDFCKSDFDILIDLSREDHLPLLFAALETRAPFKIGRFGESKQQIFDMMLEIKDDETLDEIINYYDQYINMIKPVDNEL
jgi:hypothetical protein